MLISKTKTVLAPLHIAAINRRTESIRMLIAAGADVNSKTRGGATPLDIAERRRYADIIALLTEAQQDATETTQLDTEMAVAPALPEQFYRDETQEQRAR